uniref:Uncharacterized protein n=1 Tax=Anguilla anguilla TaxID=7936 RepID=A0A0E9TH65_ANGAN
MVRMMLIPNSHLRKMKYEATPDPK